MRIECKGDSYEKDEEIIVIVGMYLQEKYFNIIDMKVHTYFCQLRFCSPYLLPHNIYQS